MTHIQARPGVVTVGGKQIRVDSQNEAKLIEWFERSGFSGLWQRQNTGAINGSSRYTNDFELSVLHNGETKRAIVEAKAYKKAFTPYVFRRMQGTMSFYKTDLLLLYTRNNNTWYKIDSADGSLTEYGIPQPGLLPLSKLPRSMSFTTEKLHGRHYQKPFNPLRWIALLIEEIIRGPKPPKKRR